MMDKTDVSKEDEEEGPSHTRQNLNPENTQRKAPNKEFNEALQSVNLVIDTLERAHLQGDNEGSEAV